jgi:hypothetical protein
VLVQFQLPLRRQNPAAEAAATFAKSALWRTNRRRPVSQVLVQFQLPLHRQNPAAEAAATFAKPALRRTNRRRPVSQVLVQFQLPPSSKYWYRFENSWRNS